MVEYEAQIINGELVIKPNKIRKANGDLVLQVPSINLISKFKEKHKDKLKDGKR